MWVKLGTVIPAIGIWSSLIGKLLAWTTTRAPRRIALELEAPAIWRQLRERAVARRARLAGLPGKARQRRNRFWPECDTCKDGPWHQAQLRSANLCP